MVTQFVIADSNLRRVEGQIPVSSLVRTVGTPTLIVVTCPQAHRLVTGQQVSIQDMAVAGYNGVFTITVVDLRVFNITLSGDPSADIIEPTGWMCKVRPTGTEVWATASPYSGGIVVEQAGCLAGTNGGVVIQDTNTHTPPTGRVYGVLSALTETVFTTVVGNLTGLDGMTLPAGRELRGVFTSVKLASGTLAAYFR
jgi:hypothetical protein